MDKINSNLHNLIIIFTKDLYKFHYALSLATSLKAIGKDISIFISGYSCNFIKKNWKDYDKEDITVRLAKKQMASIEEMFAYCKELDVKIFYCETAMEFLNIHSDEINELVSIKPKSMYSILNINKHGEIIFI